jgi:hypothetical protein
MSDCGEAIPLDDKAAWDAALAGLPHAFAHTWDSCHAMRQTTGHATFLWHYRSASAECACPFSIRTFAGREDVYTPYGFSGFCGAGDSAEMAEAWRRFAIGRGFVCGYIGLNPLLAPEAFLASPDCAVTHDIYLLDLALGEDAMFARMARGRRSEIRRWLDAGAEVIDEQDLLADYFCANLVPFLRSRGASGAYSFSEETLRSLVAAPATFLIGAGRPDAIEAATLFAQAGPFAEHMLIVTAPGKERHAVPLTWAGARRLMRSGARWLNLGGGITRDDGVARYKQLFGATKLPQPSLRQVYDRAAYDALCAAAGPSTTAFFPAYQRGQADVR